MNFSTIQFYSLVIFEAILFPFFYLKNWIINRFSSSKYNFGRKERSPILKRKLVVGIHEWGKYPAVREKNVNRVKPFSCGLKFQLERFERETQNIDSEIYLTVSDAEFLNKSTFANRKINEIIEVSNIGMDFSGYSAIFNKIKDGGNCYVILSNTSVNSIQNDFLESHLKYMEENVDVGMLGVSYSSKVYQSVIKNNFTPHLQSFYLLTTLDVLKEVVAKNGTFPGEAINHKLLLIRKSEVNLSQTILNIGYALAVVQENEKVVKFCKPSNLDNAYNAWKLKWGDVRVFNHYPNRIFPINENS